MSLRTPVYHGSVPSMDEELSGSRRYGRSRKTAGGGTAKNRTATSALRRATSRATTSIAIFYCAMNQNLQCAVSGVSIGSAGSRPAASSSTIPSVSATIKKAPARGTTVEPISTDSFLENKKKKSKHGTNEQGREGIKLNGRKTATETTRAKATTADAGAGLQCCAANEAVDVADPNPAPSTDDGKDDPALCVAHERCIAHFASRVQEVGLKAFGKDKCCPSVYKNKNKCKISIIFALYVRHLYLFYFFHSLLIMMCTTDLFASFQVSLSFRFLS
ncbi:unnamed protein product [Amoebophrya sp. A120]|nr:unnamed protein product [Amoebophrya sp. A120]|eukprot:GSA120T00017123001.1